MNVAELEQVSKRTDSPNPVLEDADFILLVGATQQFIDGEFVGYDQSNVGDIDKAVIRLDMSDGSYWTIILDVDRVKIQEDGLARVRAGRTNIGNDYPRRRASERKASLTSNRCQPGAERARAGSSK